MRVIVVLALTASGVTNAQANVRIDYENFYWHADRGRAQIILRLTNETANPMDMVIAECAFLNADEKAIDTATLIATNIESGGVAYVDGWSARVVGIKRAACRISIAR